MADRDAWESALYRYAHLLFRDGDAARQAALESIETGVRKRPAHIDPDRLVMLQFREVRRRALKSDTSTAIPRSATKIDLPPDAASIVQDVSSRRAEEILHALPEPGRSAYALLLFDAMEAEWIAKLLGLSPVEFANAVHGARLAVYEALASKTTEAAS